MKKLLLILLCLALIVPSAYAARLSTRTTDADLTPSGGWVTLDVVDVDGYSEVAVFLDVDAYKATGVGFRFLGRPTSNGDAFQLPLTFEHATANVKETGNVENERTFFLTGDLTQKLVFQVDTYMAPYLQIDGLCTVSGGDGGMAVVDNMYINRAK